MMDYILGAIYFRTCFVDVEILKKRVEKEILIR